MDTMENDRDIQDKMAEKSSRGRRQPKDPQHMSKDFDDVYKAERSRGSRRPETPETIAQKRLQREIVNMILNPGMTRRDYQAILREYGLREDTPEYADFLKIWDEHRGPA